MLKYFFTAVFGFEHWNDSVSALCRGVDKFIDVLSENVMKPGFGRGVSGVAAAAVVGSRCSGAVRSRSEDIPHNHHLTFLIRAT